MPTRNYSVSLGGGVSIAKSQARTADGGSDVQVAVPKGFAGTLTTRTDANTGTITLVGGHGIATGNNVDIYWAGGVQYDVTVGTVSTNSMPFDLGIGDDLPIATTAVVVCKRVPVNVSIDGDALSILGVQQKFASQTETAMSHVDFQDAAGDEIAQLDLQPNGVQVFDVEGGSANPFTGDPITVCYVSNGSSTADATFYCTFLQDITP